MKAELSGPWPDTALVLAALVDKGCAVQTPAEQLLRWFPGVHSIRVYRALRSLEGDGAVRHARHGFWCSTPVGVAALRRLEARRGARAIREVHAAIEKAGDAIAKTRPKAAVRAASRVDRDLAFDEPGGLSW